MFASNSSQVSSDAVFIEDVFSTYLYTGNSTSGGTQTITNNIDLSTKSGMVWIKGRSAASNHILSDTARGAGASATNNNALASNLTSAEDLGGSSYDFLSAFNADGFTVKQGGTTTATRGANYNNVTYASWTFRKQAKFFDVVTYTGNGVDRNISHNLGSTPGCVIIKQTNAVGTWRVWHRSGNQAYNYGVNLNTTGAYTDQGTNLWGSSGNANMTSTTFSVGGATGGQNQTDTNINGATYVAYLFAHNAGGFGTAGTDNVISCGSFTTDASANATVNLGYEPQWMLVKCSSAAEEWRVVDNMRGFNALDGTQPILYPDQSSSELNAGFGNITSTGLQTSSLSANSTYIYVAIRRGPMKTPTTGTSVFNTVTYTGDNTDNRLVSLGVLADGVMARQRNVAADMIFSDRLRANYMSFTNRDYDEKSYADGLDQQLVGAVQYGNSFSDMAGFYVGNSASTLLNQASTPQLAYAFRRAPGFFDVVCYTGTGSNTTVTHNLGVAPELMIVKRRSTTNAWAVYANNDNTDYLVLNTSAATVDDNTYWNDTSPTSTVFSVGTNNAVNASGSTYVAYLFATCTGVSKVGSYTGSGTTKQIDCGFTGGARFVLIKRTDSTGDWYVWDTARGIVSGNDPYILLNSTAAEVTNTDYIDAYSAGFEISSTAPAAINASGGTFVFFAIS